MIRVGLLFLFLSVLAALFTGLVAYIMLFPTMLPQVVNTVDRLVPEYGTPETIKIWVDFKNIINLIFAGLPIVMIVAAIIFLVTRAGKYEEDIV